MSRQIIPTPSEAAALGSLGQRIKLARLRRNLPQSDLAAMAGVSRKTIVALEAGSPGSSIAVLAKVLEILGYPDRMAGLLATDPIGEDMELATGRKRAGRRGDVADF